MMKLLRYLGTRQGRRAIRFALASRVLNRVARPLGFTVLADHFYHPVPNDEEILLYANRERPGAASEPTPEQVAFCRDVLSRWHDEVNDPSLLRACGYAEGPDTPLSGDVEFLYAWVRQFKPRHVIEIGSGGSTRIIAAALRQNQSETGAKSRFIAIEPYAAPDLRELERGGFMQFELRRERLQDLDPALFHLLGDGDLLFVDSSHVFKQGSDVEYEFLRVYPSLARGVTVHIHDIFLPSDYPTEWTRSRGLFWNEQYFLEVFLLCNSRFKVVAPLALLARTHPEIFLEQINAFTRDHRPGSFWMRAD